MAKKNVKMKIPVVEIEEKEFLVSFEKTSYGSVTVKAFSEEEAQEKAEEIANYDPEYVDEDIEDGWEFCDISEV